jgi:peptidyl-prolyl cis-trans isomerase SurA
VGSHSELERAARRIRGCADLERDVSGVAGALVVDLGRASESDLSPAVRARITGIAVGAASPVEDNGGQATTVVVCARQTGGGGVPTHDEISDRLFQQEMELLSERYLRNLRREATIIQR